MTRVPLRPLARILDARAKGENPDAIERENLRLRHEQMRDRARGRAQTRLAFLALCFFSAFITIGARMGTLAATDPVEPRTASRGAEIEASRADITDRNGRILATNMVTHALYVQTRDLVDPGRVAHELAGIFPELDEAALLRRFTDGRSFLWVRKVLSPEQVQKVHEIGDPGLYFGPREMRLYPNGTLAAHVLGGASFGAEGVDSAEVIGMAGLEKFEDERLRDPAQAGTPLVTSLDLTVQAAVEEVLAAGALMMNAKGGAAILMDVDTGEIVSLAAWPTFDPNDRPANPTSGEPSDSPLFNRAIQGIYELGSTFKIFAAAQAIDLGLVTPETLVDANAPMKYGKFTIKEFENHNYGPMLSVADIIARSSNVGTAHIAMMIGGERQQAFPEIAGPVRSLAGGTGRGEICPAAAPRPLARDRDDHRRLWPWRLGQPDESGHRLCHHRQWRHQGDADAVEADDADAGRKGDAPRNRRGRRGDDAPGGHRRHGKPCRSAGLCRGRQDRHCRQDPQGRRLLRRQGHQHLCQRLSRQ